MRGCNPAARAAAHSLLLPLPDLPEKGLAAQLVPVQPLLSPDLLFHHHLGGNACVVTAGVPQGSLPTHAMPVGGESAGKAWRLRQKGFRAGRRWTHERTRQRRGTPILQLQSGGGICKESQSNLATEEEAPAQLDSKTHKKVMIIQRINYNIGTKLQTKGNKTVTGNRSKPINYSSGVSLHINVERKNNSKICLGH